jgi:sigma-B regulation protein RsbU (phosphoserine phosphatase)
VSETSLDHETARKVLWSLVDAARRRDTSALASLYDRDAVALSPVFGELRGPNAIAASFEALFLQFPDMAVEVTNVLVDGDRVAAIADVHATDRAGWFGLPPTGSPIAYRLVLLLTLAGGRIVRDERLYDAAGLVERLEKARLERELATAAEVQRTLLSTTAHTSAFSESIGDSLPCRAIGGDFFEFVDLPGGAIGVAIGDVAGKGPAAALLAALLQGMLASEARNGEGPAATLAQLNRALLARALDGRFATLVYAVLFGNGRLVYSNAGHNAPFLVAGTRSARLAVGGPPLGLFRESTYDEETLEVGNADTVVMFTDGVTEATSPSGDEYGEERLLACLQAHGAQPLASLMARVFEGVREFVRGGDATDDATVVLTRFRR